MAKFATVRELKNQTTALLREAEKGKPIVVTRRGKPVATLKSFEPRDLRNENKYSTTAIESLKQQILAKHPELVGESLDRTRQEFEKITKKMRRSLPFKTWRNLEQ